MFYITKILRGKPRRYLYEAYRDKKTGKARRRLIAYLGEFSTVRQRLAHISAELARAKKEEAELRKFLEPSLCELRRAGICPSWAEISDMRCHTRRITFILPGSFNASKKIGPLQKIIPKLEADVVRLRAILPRVVVAAK